ncbi:hypothetical protein KC340_g11966 [Hortaea werneckii]|nr:hypothetical protein KC342_g4314 [Hortaea werneckii]KAI7102063.1 hypothetical protein KC339_g6283 [Hortaea werneckii]KAI7227042.1 hypothetical protein KC365_g9106 [Hortaea werneckii]KAI7305600.1 hypothetical protein KC340_g11966 [Hortaea werneckii]KAI7367487.1 hypothetical protein KC354_g3388 [Hortaea werneckii]
MAPKRKSAAARTSSRQSSQQSTLSFHGKNNRVTKPSTSQEIKAEKKDPALLESLVRADEKAEPSPVQDEVSQDATEHEAQPKEPEALDDPLKQSDEPTKTEDVLGGRAPQSDTGALGGKGSGWVSDEEQQARKISDTQIKRYWRAKEQERLAPRLHQEDMSVHERILREWDMSGQYGPCIGIARLKRWKRANVLGLKPPIEVLAVLLKDMDSGEPKSQRAYVDELMSSRFVEA